MLLDHSKTDSGVKNRYNKTPLDSNSSRDETSKLLIRWMVKKDPPVEMSNSDMGRYGNYYEHCKSQINQMREIKIGEDKITLHDFILMRENSKLLSVLRNQTNRKHFTEKAQEYQERFPEYFDDIKRNFREGRNLMEAARTIRGFIPNELAAEAVAKKLDPQTSSTLLKIRHRNRGRRI